MEDDPAVGSELIKSKVFVNLDEKLPQYIAKLESFPARMQKIEARTANLKRLLLNTS